MSTVYRSTIRVFVFMGLALFCLLVTSLVILTPWMETSPQLTATPSPALQMPQEQDTDGKWLVVRELPLPGAMLKQLCRGRYVSLPASDQAKHPYCLDEFKLASVSNGDVEEHEVTVITNPESGSGIHLYEAEQLGLTTDPNARLLIRLEGLNDCQSEILGCGYNYTIKIADLKKPGSIQHFLESGIHSKDPADWNETYTKGFGFLGLCDGGCIPEPIYGWNVKDGKLVALTDEEVYLSPDHYEGRAPDFKDDPYTHWGQVKWIDDSHIEAELIDQQGKIKKIRREVK